MITVKELEMCRTITMAKHGTVATRTFEIHAPTLGEVQSSPALPQVGDPHHPWPRPSLVVVGYGEPVELSPNVWRVDVHYAVPPEQP